MDKNDKREKFLNSLIKRVRNLTELAFIKQDEGLVVRCELQFKIVVSDQKNIRLLQSIDIAAIDADTHINRLYSRLGVNQQPEEVTPMPTG